MTDLPKYRELPEGEGGTRVAWGLWGDDDDLGLMNLVTPAKAVEGAACVRTGRRFSLDIPLDTIDPGLFGRGKYRHTIEGHLVEGDAPTDGMDDHLDAFYLQVGSQWDSLGHVAYRTDRFFNGRTTKEIRAGRNTIDHLSAVGIATRGVLLDLSAVIAERGGPGASVPITVADLEAARTAAGIEIRPGDVLLVHTGYLDWYRQQPYEVRLAQSEWGLTACGLDHGEEMIEYLWDLHIAAFASDAPAVDVLPVAPEPDAPAWLWHHYALIGGLGMMLGELWETGPLAADCAADGVHEFLLTAAPLNVPGGIGSPANALAIK